MGSDKLKTLLIALYPYNGQGLDSWHDHGAGMTYAAAKQANCDISFLDMKSLFNDQELKESIKGYDLISFGLKSSYYPIAKKVINYAKSQGSKVLVGGYHATAAPNELIENPDIDYVFYGESEITFPKFLKSPGDYGREIYGEKPQDLDLLPFIDRSIYRSQLEDCSGWWHGGKLSKMTSVMAARGCPYKCAFCQPLEVNHFGRKLRRRSVKSLIEELKQLKKLYNPECVMIHDDTFLLQPKWLEEFIDLYPQINLPFWAAGRADGICKYPDLVKRLIKVGWDLISVGFESGSQRILDLLHKGTTVEQNLESAKIIHSFGAKIYANYMTGLPWETKWDIQATHRMADEINAEMPSWAYFAPYPGCEIGEECINRGWSLLNKETYDRCPSGEKVKYVDYNYISKVRQGFREETYPEFCDIIIPTYENEHYTINCIKSIKENTKPASYRIIWVDNGSKSSSAVDDILSDIDHLSIKLPTNEGFVGAVNKGLEKSNAPNVCILNNDTLVSPNWLKKLIKTLYSDPELGIVGPLTYYGEGSGMDSHHSLSLHSSLLPGKARKWDLNKINLELEKSYSGRTYKISFVAFLCAVIKREVINKVGHLDPNYAMGMWDDLDYNRSVEYAGYRSELAIDTCIKHFGRSTFSLLQLKENLDIDSLLNNNRKYLDRKWREVKSRHILSNKDNQVFIISRAIYNTLGTDIGIGTLTEYRLSIMQKYFINSLRNQTDKNFILYLFVGDPENETTKRIESLNWGDLNVQFIYTDGNLDKWKKSKNWALEGEGSPEDIVRKLNHPMAPIMARLDTDDWVAPGWVSHMKQIANSFEQTHFLINYQILSQAPDGCLYIYSNTHTENRPSPFLVLVQKTEPRISPYEQIHIKMGNLFPTVYNIPPSYVFMVVHGENRLNKIYDNDIFIGPKTKSDLVTKHITTIPNGAKIVKHTNWRSRIQQVN